MSSRHLVYLKWAFKIPQVEISDTSSRPLVYLKKGRDNIVTKNIIHIRVTNNSLYRSRIYTFYAIA